MYGRVLVPTDESEPNEEAAEHALGLAARFDAAVDALFVVKDVGLVGHVLMDSQYRCVPRSSISE